MLTTDPTLDAIQLRAKHLYGKHIEYTKLLYECAALSFGELCSTKGHQLMKRLEDYTESEKIAARAAAKYAEAVKC